MRVATCTAQPGPLGKTEMTGPANACLLADGVTTGYVTFVEVSMYDQVVIGGAALPASDAQTALPSAGEVAQVWGAGFSLVVVCYMVARAVGVCIELIRRG
jgi:hypothetical protein